MHIIAGAWRGRTLIAPAGRTTRPTSLRMRQALFDMIVHAPWGGRGLFEGAAVLDAFAGTGALGLEALSRGAVTATFMENDPAALDAIRRNIRACRAEDRTRILPRDVLTPGRGVTQTLIFLDPPYAEDLLERSINSLRSENWIATGSIVCAEMSRGGTNQLDAVVAPSAILSHRVHGAAEIIVWRE